MRSRKAWERLDLQRRELRFSNRGDAAIERRTAAIEAEMLQVEADMRKAKADGMVTTESAFVVFEWEVGRRKCLEAHNPEGLANILDRIGCRQIVPRFHGKETVRLAVNPAPEPTDVYWENLEVTKAEVFCRSIRTLLATLFLIGVTAGILSAINILTDNQVENLTNSDRRAGDELAFGLSVLSAGVVTIVNVGLKIAITKLTDIEYRDTRTEYEESLYLKLAAAYIVNQSLIVLFVNPNVERWFEPGGAIQQAFFIILTNAVVPELMKVLRVDYALRREVLGRLAKSQAKLEQRWEPPVRALRTGAVGALAGFTPAPHHASLHVPPLAPDRR